MAGTQVRGYGLIYAALILGLLQALFTIPSGGGMAYFVFLGGILGFVGYLVVASKNPLPEHAKKWAILGALLFIIVIVIASVQIFVIGSAMDKKMATVDEEIDNLNEENWEEQKHTILTHIKELIDFLLYFIILLALSTAMLCWAACTPSLFTKKKNVMIIPVVIALSAVIAAAALTWSNFSTIKGYINDIDSATTYDELMDACSKVINYMAVITVGSQIGGVLNLIAFILALIFIGKSKLTPKDTAPPTLEGTHTTEKETSSE